jgi:archaellum biogenesis ATPase FlaH
MNPLFKTDVPFLDDLLGGGISPGAVVLVKGAPGAGKTTLCAQIAGNTMRRGQSCLYLSTEERGHEGVARLSRCFRALSPDERRDRLKCLPIAAMVGPEHKDSLDTMLTEFWEIALRNDKSSSHLTLVILDSLPALVDRLCNAIEPPPTNRQVVRSLLHTFSQKPLRRFLDKHKGLLFLTSEVHDRSSVLHHAESYLADVIIDLTQDRILISPEAKRPEQLRFCTITKSRDVPNQRRRCCYDFSDEGISLFPTYAADGQVMLFWENAPQWKMLNDLEDIDFATLYPLVSIKRFTRSALQTTFSVHRSANSVPRRKSMVLCSFDEYWIDFLKRDGQSGCRLLELIDPQELKLYLSGLGDVIIPELEAKGLHKVGQFYCAIPFFVNHGLLVYRGDVLNHNEVPRTWKQLKTLCQQSNRHFLIETKTYDSFMSFVFEWLWNHGVDFASDSRSLHWRDGKEVGLNKAVAAFKELSHWFREGIIPRDSSVEPNHHDSRNWLFARHWYSTLVDTLYERSDVDTSLRPRQFQNVNIHDLELKVAPLPISEEYLADQAKILNGVYDIG